MIEVYTADLEKIGIIIRYSDGTMRFIQDEAVSRNVKDRLFRFIFGHHKHKEWALALYNSVEGKNFTNPEDLDIVTLENAIYMHMKNDVSILVSSWNLAFFEHQSTLNPNMPFRLIQYWSSTMGRYIKKHKLDIYGRKPIQLPNPEFHIFYNGKEETEKTSVLKLSDLYYNEDEEPSLELCVIQHNINGIDQNSGFSRQLYEYEWLVEKIRESAQNVNIAAAVNLAIEEMPEDFTIRDWVPENKSEVIEMSIFEYNEQEHLAHVREEGIAEGMEKGRAEGMEKGRAEGMEKGRIHGILKGFEMLKKGGIAENKAIEMISEEYQTSAEEIIQILSSCQ